MYIKLNMMGPIKNNERSTPYTFRIGVNMSKRESSIIRVKIWYFINNFVLPYPTISCPEYIPIIFINNPISINEKYMYEYV